MEKQSFKERWQSYSPKVRWGLIGGSLLLLVLLFLILTPAKKGRVPSSASNQPPIRANMLLPRPQDRTVEQLAGSLSAQDSQLDRMRRQAERQDENLKNIQKKVDDAIKLMGNNKTSDNISTELLDELKNLKERLDHIDAKVDLTSKNTDQSNYGELATSEHTQTSYHQPVAYEEQDEIELPKITIIGEANPVENEDNHSDEMAPYLVANSMVEGVLLNGMDAPTDQSTRNNPVPAIIRLKTEAVLPNLVNISEVQECFLSVSGYGDMADERAKLRTEVLSCVLPNEDMDQPPRIVEANVEGFVISNIDGKVGLRGRIRSKQGQLIAKTLLAGTLGGFADAMKPQRVQGLDIDPGSRVQTQTFDASTVAASSMAQGVSSAASSISDYYLKLADQMMPVLEIDAMTPVTVAFLKGVELK